MTTKAFMSAAAVALGLAGCANMDSTEQRVVSGAATGYIVDQSSNR